MTASNSSEGFLARACPGCGTSPPPVAAVRAALPAEQRDTEFLRPYWNGFFKEKTFFSYARCEGCGLLFAPQFFTNSQLQELYAQMPDNTAGLPVAMLEKTQRGYFDIFRRYVKSGGGLLEIGPDIGLFTQQCVDVKLSDRYWLFEPNRNVWPELRDRMGSSPHEIRADMFDFGAIPDRSLSAAVMIHVLDHLIDPVDTLKKLRPKLRADATLLFVTHDESSAIAKLTKAGWPAYCLQHPQLFNPGSIAKTLRSAGYDTLAVKKTKNYFPVTYLLRHLFWALGIRKIRVPQINSFYLPLKLGNIATIAKPIQ